MGNFFSDHGGAIAGAVLGGPIGLSAGMGADAANANAEAQREAAAQSTAAVVQAAQIAANAQQHALETQLEAARTRRAEDIAAAERARTEANRLIDEAVTASNAAIRSGADFSNREFASAFSNIQNNLMPWVQTGTRANTQINSLMGFNGADEARNALVTDPSYQFRLDQGRRTMDRGAAARGNLYSGRAGAELQDYGQNMASQEFSNAFNRLMSLSNQGLGATNTLGGYQWNLAQNRSANEQNVRNTESQNALNRANAQSQNAWNVTNAGIGGNALVANTAINGAQNTANTATTGAYNISNAQQNQAYANAGADMMQNNAIPNALNQGMNQAIQIGGLMYGIPQTRNYNSFSNTGGGYPTRNRNTMGNDFNYIG